MDPIYFQKFLSLPEWQAWERYVRLNPESFYNIEEVRNTGRIKVDHFEAFANYSAEQHKLYLLLKLKDCIPQISHVNLHI